MDIAYPETGICGLSCKLCPRYHTEGKSRCGGCKSEFRMGAGCSFITCAVKRKGVEFCWECDESATCEKWMKHREFGREHDSFKCYQKLEDDIAFLENNGVETFEEEQGVREEILVEMLRDFNEGRSKSYYCIAVTVMETGELREALAKAENDSSSLDIKARAKDLHSILDGIAADRGYHLKLRK